MDEALFKNRNLRFGALAGFVIHAMNNLMQDYASNKTLKQSMNEEDYEHFHRANLRVLESVRNLLKYGDESFSYFSKYQYTTVQVISDKNSIIRDLRLRNEAYMTLHGPRHYNKRIKYAPKNNDKPKRPSLKDALRVARKYGYQVSSSNDHQSARNQKKHTQENRALKNGGDLFGALNNSGSQSSSSSRAQESSHNSDVNTNQSQADSKSSNASKSTSQASESSSSVTYHSADPTMSDLYGPVNSLKDTTYSDSLDNTSSSKNKNSKDSKSKIKEPSSANKSNKDQSNKSSDSTPSNGPELKM